MTILLLIALAFAALVLCGWAYQALGLTRDRGRFPPTGRMLDIGGRRLHLVDSGQGSPAVIFEAGISATSLNWTLLLAPVARFARACAYDRGSLGWSDPAPAPRVTSKLIDELHALLSRSAIPPPYLLVGHSFGGMLVRAYAGKYPDQVAGLILIDPLSPTEWMNPTETRLRLLRRGVMLSRRGAVLARFGLVRLALALLSGGGRRLPKAIARLSSGTGESVISRLVGEVRKMPPEVWPMIQAHWSRPSSFRGMADYLESLPASSAEAAGIALPASIPLTILSGRDSLPTHLEERDALAKRSRLGDHIIARKAGHWVHLDEPELVVRAIQEMVDLIRKG